MGQILQILLNFSLALLLLIAGYAIRLITENKEEDEKERYFLVSSYALGENDNRGIYKNDTYILPPKHFLNRVNLIKCLTDRYEKSFGTRNCVIHITEVYEFANKSDYDIFIA